MDMKQFSESLRKAHEFMKYYLNNPDFDAIAADSKLFNTLFEADIYCAVCRELERLHSENDEQISLN